MLRVRNFFDIRAGHLPQYERNNELSKDNEKNIKMQIKQTISNRCKETIKRYIDNSLEKYDNIYYQNKYSIFFKGQADILTQLKDKVGLATAWFNNKYSNIDLDKAFLGHSDCIIHNSEAQDELRRKELNSNK